MEKQESRGMESDEDWEYLSECSGFLDESSTEKILQGLKESPDNNQEHDKDQEPDTLEEDVVGFSGETQCQAKPSASLATIAIPESFTLEAEIEQSSVLMSSPVSPRVLCNACSNQANPTEKPTKMDPQTQLTTPIHYPNEENKRRETYCAECKNPLHSTDGKLNPEESGNPEQRNTHRDVIGRILNEMSDRRSDAVNKLEAMDFQGRAFLKRTETLRDDINKRRNELKELVDRHADSLIAEVDSWKTEVSQVQETEMEAFRRYLDSLDGYRASCAEILEDGSLSDIQEAAVDLENKGRNLCQLPKDGHQGLFNAFRVSLKKTKIEDLLTTYYNNNDNNIIGVLADESDIQDFEQISEEKKISSANGFPMKSTRIEKISREWKLRNLNRERVIDRADPVLVGTMRTKAAEKEDKGILGVAFLDDELFVVSRDSSEVEVFDCRRFIFSCELDLDCLLNPEDIASCSTRKCLYIMDRKTDRSRSEVLRVDIDGNLIKRWSTGGRSGRISVTPEGNVLLCMYKTTMLNEYTADGVLLRVIQFPSEVGLEHPRHAIKLTSGHYLVGHGETGDPVQRVVKANVTGKVLSSFPSRSRLDTDEEVMKRPFHLVADAEGQHVLVADADNRRVLMLNGALELESVLLSGDQHGLRYPARLCFDASGGLLYIADNKVGDKRILVFLIK